MKKNYKPITSESSTERIFNSITHGIGSVLSVVALILMVVYASYNSDAWSIVGVS
ncbi:MAG TPA: hemolysin III family protein, partial [Candidatus Marinimicrobia bacterium]|nr:hemolysin III family protein [Candidatus Neomarinimicrobiota bacterium]